MNNREAFRNYLQNGVRIGESMEKTFNAGYQAGLASQAQQPKGMNAHGLDARYFHGKLSLILRDIENYKPEEMYRELSRLANVLETLPAPTMSQFATKSDYEAAMQSQAQQDDYASHDTAAHHKWLKQIEAESAGQVNELSCDDSQAQQTESQWISVDERLPEAHTTVLVVTNFGDIYTCRLPVIVNKNSALDLENGIRERFTHWMPLPPAPEGDKPCA